MAPKLMEAGGDNSTILWKALRPKKNNQEIEALKKGDKKYSRIAPDKGRNKRIHHSARDRRGGWTGHTGIRAIEQPGGTEKSKRIRPLSGKILHSAGVQNSAETVKEEEGRCNGQNTK